MNTEQLTLSLEVPLASPSASQEDERDWMANLVSCSSISELYGTFAQIGFCGRTSPEYFPSTTGEHSVPLPLPYKTSGMAWHGECWTLNSCEWPSGTVTEESQDGSVLSHSAAGVCFLSDVLERSEVPQRFYLSATACEGILRQAANREKSLPPRLEEALRMQAAM